MHEEARALMYTALVDSEIIIIQECTNSPTNSLMYIPLVVSEIIIIITSTHSLDDAVK